MRVSRRSNIIGMMFVRIFFILTCVVGTAAAQQLYRWTDEKGRVHITDTLPPAGAKDVRKMKPKPAAAAVPAKPVLFALARAMKEFPVTLYTSPNCAEPCATARDLLNMRGVPFSEVQVWEEESNAELKRVSGNTQVPTLRVGSTVRSGFEPSAYDSLLDSAGYPAPGVLPARAQAAPERPEGYLLPGEREAPKAEPVKPEPGPSGPYAPGAAPQRAQK
jgi:glutaredoxin